MCTTDLFIKDIKEKRLYIKEKRPTKKHYTKNDVWLMVASDGV